MVLYKLYTQLVLQHLHIGSGCVASRQVVPRSVKPSPLKLSGRTSALHLPWWGSRLLWAAFCRLATADADPPLINGMKNCYVPPN